MEKGIRASGYQGIRVLLILLFLNSSFVISNLSFASDVPHFYGEEVVVTASKLPQPASRSPWETSTISQQELENYKNVGEVLHSAVGLDSISYGSYGALDSVRLRGANSSQVLILVDGRRINSPTLGMFDLGDLTTDNLERVEIVRAPLSALYGSDAVSGVINLITRSPDKKQRAVYFSAGSFGTQQESLNVGNSMFLLSADNLKSDGFRQNGDFLGLNVFGKATIPVAIGKLVADCSYYNADKGVPGVPTSEADPHSASEPNDRQKDKNLLASVSLINDNFTLRAYQNSLTQQLNPYVFGASSNEASQAGAEWQQSFFSGIGQVLYGLEARQDRGKTTYSGDHTIQNYAGFIQDSFSLNEKLSFDFGVRGDKHSVAGTSINPRLGLVYHAREDLVLRASAGSAFRAPTLNELYWNDGFMFGNTGLKPEKSGSYSFGLERKITERTTAQLAYFSAVITDQILWVYDSSTFKTNATNLGEVYSQGVEFELTRRLVDAGKGFINFTYQTAVNQKDTNAQLVGKDIPYTPRTKYNVGLVMAGSSVIIRHVGERFGDARNTIKLTPYTVVDLRLSKKVGPIEISLSADNLFDERYNEAIGYDPTTFTARGYPMPGRRFSAGVKWEI